MFTTLFVNYVFINIKIRNMSNNQKLQDKIDSKLLDDRKIFLWGQVDDDSAKHIIDRLMFLEMEAPGKDIQLIINSPGGYVTAGFAIYDTIKGISSPVSTVATGIGINWNSLTLDATFAGSTTGQFNGNSILANLALVYSF